MTVVIVGHKSFVAMVMFRIAGMNIETVRSVATSPNPMSVLGSPSSLQLLRQISSQAK